MRDRPAPPHTRIYQLSTPRGRGGGKSVIKTCINTLGKDEVSLHFEMLWKLPAHGKLSDVSTTNNCKTV